MPEFFFTVTTGQEKHEAQSTFLHSTPDACDEAVSIAGEILKASDGSFWKYSEWRLEVTDESGEAVCLVSMEGWRRTSDGETSD